MCQLGRIYGDQLLCVEDRQCCEPLVAGLLADRHTVHQGAAEGWLEVSQDQ